MTPGAIPASCSLPGADLIQPATQGDYDGLCGLYCIINAIRLVMAYQRELDREEVRALFTAGVRYLEQKGSLAEALHSCVSKQGWPKLAERIVATAQPMADPFILLERPRLSKDAPIIDIFRCIEKLIASGKAPCVFLRGRYRHYSVISGYTPASLRLFDSYGHRWVWRRSCGTTETSTALHRIQVQSIIALSTV